MAYLPKRADRVGKERQRVSYLLRLWQTEQEGVLVWRASLQDAHTGERRGFASLEGLFAFLQQQMAIEITPAYTATRPDIVAEEEQNGQVD